MRYIFAMSVLFCLGYAEVIPSQNPGFIKSVKNICGMKASIAKNPDCKEIAQIVTQRLQTKECLDPKFLYDICAEECENTLQDLKTKTKK